VYRSALAHRDLRLLLTAMLVSMAGSWAYNVALLTVVYERTESLAWVGAATLGRFIPQLLFSPYAGVVADRFERLNIVLERSALARHEARVGRQEQVLVEGPSKRKPEVTSGRTRQNKLAHFRADGRALTPGSFATVEIHRAGPHFLEANLVEVEADSPENTGEASPGGGGAGRSAIRRRIPLSVA